MNKKMTAFLLTMALILTMAAPATAAAAGAATAVNPGDCVHDYVTDHPLSRSDLAVIAIRLAGLESKLADYAGKATFDDVLETTPHKAYIVAAYSAGVLTKIGDTPIVSKEDVQPIEPPAPETPPVVPMGLPPASPEEFAGDLSADIIIVDAPENRPDGTDGMLLVDSNRADRINGIADGTADLLSADPSEPVAPVETGVFKPEQPVTQQEAVAFLLRYSGLKDTQLGAYPYDYECMSASVGLTAGMIYVAENTVTAGAFSTMLANVAVLYNAVHAENKQPLFINGKAQPIFEYTPKDQKNGDSGAIRFCVYVETDYDTDGDGKLDLIKALVQLPHEVLSGMKVATIYEARPYITGCNTMNPGENYGTENFDISSMYHQPARREPNGTLTTAAAAKAANPDDWYYEDTVEGGMMYENLDWYDYYLVRGFGIVECGGIGTKGSQGFESCGSDLELDAFKCVIEWLNGDANRTAYTNKEDNIAISADWSNHNIGMTGRSYAGTTQFGLATTGVEGLKTVVPVAGIASWYDYTNSQGLSTDRKVNYTETLAWYCNGRFQDKADYATIATPYGNYLNQLRIDQLALNGDYGPHWQGRDYTLNGSGIKCPALIVHGLNDENVRTKQFDMMYNAFTKAGQNTKLLLHQGTHVTPTQSGKGEMYIGDQLYDDILNKWFSHYLYGVENGIENMPTVTAQNNVDGNWSYYDTWTESTREVVLSGKDAYETAATVVNSDLKTNHIKSWRTDFTAGPTACSAMYTMDVTEDMRITGPVAVHIKASADVSRDPLKMSAMLVERSETDFPTFTANGSYLPVSVLQKNGAWMGGGVANYDLIKYDQTPAKYKIIAQGWADMNNPAAGYESKSSSVEQKITLVPGENHDYTIYLQPSLYTVKAGHKLSLVIFPSSSSIDGESTYNITIDNAATYASIPVYQAPVSNDTGTVTPPAPKLDPPSVDEKSGDATVKIPVKAAVRGDTASAKVPERAVSSAITSAMKAAEKSGGSAIVKIEVDAAADAKAVETTLTNKSLSKVADGKIASLEIATPVANIALNRKALSAISENAKSGVKISAARVETDRLTAAQAAQIGGAPVFDFTVTSGEDTISDFNGGAATIAMPYTLKEGEDAAFITVWLLDDGGKLVPLKGQYANGMVTFVTEHFSRYAIGYLPFADVATDWSYEGVVYAYNQHLFVGVEQNRFAPDADMTRGMLWTVLYRMAGSPNKTENAVWYADAQAWVIAQNISDGNHQENKISREQLAVMLYRFAKGTTVQTDMSKFTDEAESSDFAADAMRWAVENGILNGSEGKLHPQGSATRAEVAAMLQRLANIKK